MLERKPKQCLMIFTEKSMADVVNNEKKKGRFPDEFEIILVNLPGELAANIAESQRVASKEVTPDRSVPQ